MSTEDEEKPKKKHRKRKPKLSLVPDNVVELETNTSYSVTIEKTFARAMKVDWDRAIVLGYNQEGRLEWYVSEMLNGDLIWMLEQMKHILMQESITDGE